MKVEPGDRRFFADKVDSANKGNNKYFTELYDEIISCKYDRTCFEFFKSRKIKVESFQIIYDLSYDHWQVEYIFFQKYLMEELFLGKKQH